jgi:hypothetical protein
MLLSQLPAKEKQLLKTLRFVIRPQKPQMLWIEVRLSKIVLFFSFACYFLVAVTFQSLSLRLYVTVFFFSSNNPISHQVVSELVIFFGAKSFQY